MLTQIEKRYYTPEEYFALEEQAEYKSEYHAGEIIPMIGGTTNHNKISLNFCRKFPLSINNQNYEVFMGDVRLALPRYQRYVYPDVMVIQGKPIYEGTGTTTVRNPLLIVEVLSKSTQSLDRGNNFFYYRSIPEFKEYILIDQYSYYVEQYTKTDQNQWVLTEYDSAESVLSLRCVEFKISFNELYYRVNFDENEE
jgi:Uma2 family endonuclease